jgi:hypothetical protein
MDEQPVVGWNRDPAGPDEFRYWNGQDWTAHATATDNGIVRTLSTSGHRIIRHRRIMHNTVVFHVLAWFDCSVPFTRGRLRRFTRPIEARTIDQIWALRDGPLEPGPERD